MTTPVQVAVIGGGISGLACAHRLRQTGHSIALLESQDTLGGVIGTIDRNGFKFEAGPQSFLATAPVLDLVRDLGIEGELLRTDPRALRYVFARGRLHQIPISPLGIMTSSLLSAGSRVQVLSEAFRRTKPPKTEESVADFVRRKFGQEILDYLVAPFVSGVYAGDPEMLSLKAAFPSLEEWERVHGSVIRGAMNARKQQSGAHAALCSFRSGMKSLIVALESRLGDSILLGARVEAIERSSQPAGPRFSVHYSRSGQGQTIPADAIVIATPAYVAAALINAFSRHGARLLSGVAYAPVAVVGLAYRRQQVANSLLGFGVLIPRKEGLRTLGTVWNSSLFSGRAPEGAVVLTSFAGGVTDTEIVGREPNAIAEIVELEIGKLLQISGAPVECAVWRYPKGLPQYNLGHGHIVEGIEQEIATTPALFLTGNYLRGPSIGSCIEGANETAENIRSFLTGAGVRTRSAS